MVTDNGNDKSRIFLGCLYAYGKNNKINLCVPQCFIFVDGKFPVLKIDQDYLNLWYLDAFGPRIA